MSKSNPFADIGYDDFRRFAKDPSLSKYEKIGFPDSYRKGFEEFIFSDILEKLTLLRDKEKNVLDIGPGCSDLPRFLIKLCKENKHQLHLIDSEEMLALIPDDVAVRKYPAIFPNCQDFINQFLGKMDVILCYSVLHYILVDVAFFRFLDSCLALLAPGGQLLIGDIPNISKRKRFFSSDAGIRFHQHFMKTADKPDVRFNQIEHNYIDDAIVMAILNRSRLQGFDAYLLPQGKSLPMSNRREDILIIRP